MNKEFYERIYAGVLGKLIGVYLGRPVENIINYKKLIDTVGIVDHFVNDSMNVPLVVTDDDIGGTFTFCKALGRGKIPSPKEIGEAWLNYLIENKTILWWGGLGCSTEHTAYIRLRQGYIPPESGSASLNSKGVSEQIGAQIFIDGWAMFAAGDPDLAVELARRAACVSHDGEAIYAAMVIAAIESLAFVESDIRRIIRLAAAYIPEKSAIHALIEDMFRLRDEEPDWLKAREYIEQNYGYALFPGSCHVIPNHALIIFSLLYGDGDFSKTLSIVVTSGWDTDCNGGNVGCIMGILTGLDGIGAGRDWRSAFADACFIPSANPGGGISDAVSIAYDIINYRLRYEGLTPLNPKNGSRYHFEMPGALQGFFVDKDNSILHDLKIFNVSENSRYGLHALCIKYSSKVRNDNARIGVYTYIPPHAKKMVNYDFITSPELYSGQTIRIGMYSDKENQTASFRIFAKYYGVKDEILIAYSPLYSLSAGSYEEYCWTLDGNRSMPYFEAGIEVYPQEEEQKLYLDYMTWDGEPDIKFTNPKLIGEMAIRSWISNIGHYPNMWASDDFVFVSDISEGLHFTGSMKWMEYSFDADIKPQLASEFGLISHVQGMTRYIGFTIKPDSLNLIQRYDSKEIRKTVPYAVAENEVIHMRMETSGDKVECYLGAELIFSENISIDELGRGGCGIICSEGTIAVNNMIVAPLRR